MKEYRPPQYDSSYWCLSASFGDFNILCTTAHFASLVAQQGVDVYTFVFAYPPSNNGFYATPDDLGAYHASEIPFIWHTYFDFTPSEEQLSQQIQGAWLQFAKEGSPGVVDGLAWPSWKTSDGSSQINVTSGEIAANATHKEAATSPYQSFQFNIPECNVQDDMGIPDRCKFWDEQPPYTPQTLLGGCSL
tara:strand:- start:1766 stop:2335 length:570 start_codon:yes stop_codon:yes gene_type:complete